MEDLRWHAAIKAALRRMNRALNGAEGEDPINGASGTITTLVYVPPKGKQELITKELSIEDFADKPGKIERLVVHFDVESMDTGELKGMIAKAKEIAEKISLRLNSLMEAIFGAAPKVEDNDKAGDSFEDFTFPD